VRFAGLVALAMLVAPSLAAAHLPPLCPETWNPAMNPPPAKFTGVPGGWSTAPGTTNESTPQNPDGFFLVSTPDGHDVELWDGCPGFGGPEEGNGTGDLITTVESGTAIKYTEANGKEIGFSLMAGSNQPGSPAGDSSDYIYVHVWGQGDLWVCDAEDDTACTCCFVPPPPFTPPPE
jgi:hypothetical protein